MSIVIHNGKIITGTAGDDIIDNGSLIINGARIESIGHGNERPMNATDEVVDASGYVVIPGFIQTHVHLCQTLFRGMADDLQLLDWLQQRIFPFEAAHNERSMYASAMIGIAELIRSGTTTILDMGSIRHEEAIVRAIGESGLRAFVGKAMMDVNDLFPALNESTQDSLSSTHSLAKQFHNSYDGRIKYAVAPRFVLSCSDRLMREAFEMIADFDGMLFHTHASENKNEISAVRQRCGMDNVEFLHHLGVLSEKSILAHCIHVSENEIGLLASSHSNVAHCPSSNLKLGSGIANIPRLLSKGINVSLGADGAPCNNNLNMFEEMRLASLLQKPVHGPTAMPGRKVFEMATIAGARALGLEKEIGSLEVGKKADLVILDLQQAWNPSHSDSIYSSIVYSASPENVVSVMIDGRWVYRNKSFTTTEEPAVVQNARRELSYLIDRM